MLQLTLAAQGLPNLQNLLLFMSILLVWATLRPNMVRDYDNRRLPNNPTARLLFAFICIVIYVALAVFLHKFGDFARRYYEAMPAFLRGLIDGNKEAAPLLAAMMLGTLMQLGFFRDLERSLIIWLHSVRHLHGDSIQLAKHIERCKFAPNDDERERNRSDARRFGVYVVDNGIEGVNLVTFHSWRKVASLLRLLREWNATEGRIFSERELDQIEVIETAHERKTQLAMTIVKMVDQVERGGKRASALSDLLAMLTGTGHGDRANVDAVETKLKQVLEGGAGGDLAGAGVGEAPLRLSSRQFEAHLQEIEGYFKVEYDILLGQVAALTAKSVVLSGEDAPERIEALKGLGFQGLGRIEPINFDRILWMFLLVAGGGFLVMFLGNIRSPVPPSYDRLFRFSIVMAIAALIGAMVGSRRTHARALSTPWASYFAAGLAAAAANVAISEVWELLRVLKTGVDASSASTQLAVTSMAAAQTTAAPANEPSMHVRTLIWSFLPGLLTIAVCRLGRFEAWPGIERLGWGRPIAERTLDGLAVSLAVLIGYYLSIGCYRLFGWDLPLPIQQLMDKWHILPIPVMTPLQLLGFFIGFFTLRDVRRAAQSSMIEKPAASASASARTSGPSTGATRPDAGSAEPAHPGGAQPGSPLPV